VAELNPVEVSTTRSIRMAKGMKGKGTSKGFIGGGKNGGFVTTPMNAPKKGFKGK
jgi:hypothetical protein